MKVSRWVRACSKHLFLNDALIENSLKCKKFKISLHIDPKYRHQSKLIS